MYDSEIATNIMEDIYSLVESYIEQTEYGSCPDFELNDVIILYIQDKQLQYTVEHFNNYLLLDSGKVALCHLYELVNKSGHRQEPDYDKIDKFVKALPSQDIPDDVIEKAEELSNDNNSYFTLELDHTSSDGSFYYLCKLTNFANLAFVIKKRNRKISVYTYIEPYGGSEIPNQVLDFIYPNTKEYTYIRHLGIYKEESIFFPCDEETKLADGFFTRVDVLVAFDKKTNDCRYIKGEQANRLFCKLDR